VNISENLKHNIRESVGRHDATIVEIACRGESRAPVFDIFIDNEQAEVLELDVVAEQAVGADDAVDLAGLDHPKLVGTPERTTLDLNTLSAAGVEIVGRLAAIRDGQALFSGGLRNHCALADLKMDRLLAAFDEWARGRNLDAGFPVPERFEPTRVPDASRLKIDLRSGEIRSIVWATGFRPDYSWLDVPVVDHKGHLRHDGGVVDAPGLYVLGLPVLRRRKSSFIHGAEDDAREVVDHLAGYLAKASG